MKTALIFGINGQDGFYLKQLLNQKGYHVVGYDGDIRDGLLVESTIRDAKPNEIYNLVGQQKDRISFEFPYDVVSAICTGTLNVLESIKNINQDIRYFQSSSSEIFGREWPDWFNARSKLKHLRCPIMGEYSGFKPSTPYSIARVFSQNMVAAYRNEYDIHASVGILFNHESPKRNLSYVTRKITNTIAKIKLGMVDKLELGNVGIIKDYGFAGDYVKAMWLMLQQDIPDDYVIATKEPTSVLEFAIMTFDIAEINNPYSYMSYNQNEICGIIGDNRKAKTVLGWNPEFNVRDLAKLMYNEDMKGIKNEN